MGALQPIIEMLKTIGAGFIAIGLVYFVGMLVVSARFSDRKTARFWKEALRIVAVLAMLLWVWLVVTRGHPVSS
ncbi:hypothetical protein [Azonexus sp. R2A61]|uniref:hypothetical protein n=1 Tax=Azonexus sp. R2A61 TaxID=2744443 RepID=UPI001F216ABA|nr:hypothetical protein [Azonexus sp. R2A61]